MKKTAWILPFALLALACGGADRATKKNMLEWAEVLQVELATSQYNSFPERLGDLDPAMRAHLSRTDAWGTELLYRRLRDNRYDLISAGPDGEFGNADDIALETGHLRDPMPIYAQRPIQPDQLP